MKNINVRLGVKGRYKLSAMKDGKVTRETPWFDNLITNQGLDYLATTSNYMAFCQVGTSSTTPSFTDIALGARVAGIGSPVATESINTGDRYLVARRVYSFLAGAAAGNIAEVGVGTAATGSVLFSRALVLDGMGDPTTITVLSDEDLVVVYELWYKQPTVDFPDTVDGYDITIRAANVDSTTWWSAAASRAQFVLSALGSPGTAFTGSMGAITGAPTGTSGAATIKSDTAYVSGSYEKEGLITWSTSAANFSIKSFSWIFGPGFWQMELDTAIPKTSVQTLKLGVKLSWGRDSGPA